MEGSAAVCVDVDRFHVSRTCILVSQRERLVVPVVDVFWDATILPILDMTHQSQSALSELRVHAGKASTRRDIGVRQSVLIEYE